MTGRGIFVGVVELGDLVRVCCFGCCKRVSKSVQARFNGIEAVMVRTVNDSETASPVSIEASTITNILVPYS